MAYDNTDGRLRGRKLQAARLRIWSADPHCARCRKLVAYPHGFELDHITALHKDGSTNDDDNMQVLCPSCHQSKTAQDMGFKERSKFDAQGRVVW
ncbi:MAG: HNH endonuclease signature motif containing protein [Desulfuromonadaceae bacterium]